MMRHIPKLIALLSLSVLMIVGCRKEEPFETATQQGPTGLFGGSVQIDVAGRVFGANGEPLAGAVVRAGIGTQSVTTDDMGAFVLNGIGAYERLGHVVVSKPGYFDGSRSFVPVAGLNVVRIAMLPKTLSGTVQSSTGGSVVLDGAQVTLPPGGFARNGTTYEGVVRVYAHHLDPNSPELFDRMPGTLLGRSSSALQILRSFGMITVELTDEVGDPVTLSSGNLATINFQVPSSLIAEAEQSIDLWHYDETLGHWITEGEAELVGNEYVAEVSHFSWWNCDMPGSFVQFNGKLRRSGSEEPVTGARINVSSQTMGDGVTHANPSGNFGGPVPSGQVLTISVYVYCDGGGELLVHQQECGPFTTDTELTFSVLNTGMGIVSGAVSNCDGAAVSNGYVLSNGLLHFFTSGGFSFMSCTGPALLSAYDQGNDQWSSTSSVVLSEGLNDVGAIQACGSSGGAGTVVDIDGNAYPTIVIGSQVWTASNLRTSRYANGDPIPQEMDASTWGALSTGAWTTSVLPSYEADYGKHYNWYAVTDPRNVCPTGWHAATDADWKQMELALGMPVAELDLASTRGIAQNVGGKLKSLSDQWSPPNAGATNETGFSAHPGGLVWGGSPSGQYYWARFWTATEASPDHGWIRNLDKSNGGIWRYGSLSNADKHQGHSVRCVQD